MIWHSQTDIFRCFRGKWRANDFAPHHLHRPANPVLSDLRTGMRGPCGRAPFFFLLFSPTFSHFLLSAKEEKEKIGKKTPPQLILKRILSGGEVSRLHRDGEGYTFTDTREPHHYRTPAFSLAAKGAKKKLGKKKRRQAVSPLRRRGGLRALLRRQSPLKRGLDSPNGKGKNVG